jgi:endoglycosylceramidase
VGSRRASIALGLAVGLSSAALFSPAARAATPGPVPAAALAPQLPWLHVAHPSGSLPVIEDSAGRRVILRGVNLVGLEDDFYSTPSGAEPGPAPFWPISPAAYEGRCPTNSHDITEPPVCEVSAARPEWEQSGAADSLNDLAQMRTLGFNVIRLPVNWSQIEPTAGHYNSEYLERIAQVVDWAAAQGIYSVIDMHEDNYSRFTPETAPLDAPGGLVGATQESGGHADGAPEWAVMASGVPAEGVDGQGELNAYAESAFTSFWENRVPTAADGQQLPQGEAPGPGLQDHYIGAVAAVVRTFAGDPAVAGFELMNEPLPGFIPPGVFDQDYLFPFYRRIIDAVTGTRNGVVCPVGTPYQAECGYADLGVHDTRHLFFVEPMAARNLTDAAVGLSAPFTTYPNVVYAPHVYTHVFTADTFLPSPLNTAAGEVFPVGYGQALTTAETEARLIGAALWIGEYGDANDDDNSILAHETAELDQAGEGSALWSWKANCAAGLSASLCEPGLWSMYYASTAAVPADNGALIPSRAEYVSRAYPRAVVGSILSFDYEPAAATFSLSARYTGRPTGQSRSLAGLEHDTVVFLPGRVTGAVRVSGAAQLVLVAATPDGDRLVFVAPTGAGTYAVTAG